MAKPFIKPVISPEEAAALVKPGASLMVGGFNYGGAPYTLIDALCAAGTRDINLICVDTSWYNDKEPEPVGVARLVVNGQLGSLVASHIGLNRRTQELYTKGELMVELIPMGTFVERIRAGGAGLGGTAGHHPDVRLAGPGGRGAPEHPRPSGRQLGLAGQGGLCHRGPGRRNPAGVRGLLPRRAGGFGRMTKFPAGGAKWRAWLEKRQVPCYNLHGLVI